MFLPSVRTKYLVKLNPTQPMDGPTHIYSQFDMIFKIPVRI